MISEAELAQLRVDQNALLPDTCTVTRGDSTPTFDEETGTYTADPATVIYEGPCRVMPVSLQARSQVFGEQAVDASLYQATLPYDVGLLQKDDVFTVVSSADEQLVGRHLEVHGFEVSSLQTVRRVLLQEVR